MRDIRYYLLLYRNRTNFIKDGKKYRIPGKKTQSEQAYRSKISYRGKPMEFVLRDDFGNVIPEDKLYVPYFKKRCETCGSRLICNGCSQCGRCK